MSSGRFRRNFIGRIAPVALGFQCLALFAMPLALCCCLGMAGEGATYDSRRGSHHDSTVDREPAEEACSHHDLSVPATDHTGSQDAGCKLLDRLVIALAGLIGVIDAHPMGIHPLAALAVVSPLTVHLVETTLLVESPPPRS